MQQTDFMFEVYPVPFGHVLPATDRSECYAYAVPSGNVFRFDYKYYISADASPNDAAHTCYFEVPSGDCEVLIEYILASLPLGIHT